MIRYERAAAVLLLLASLTLGHTAGAAPNQNDPEAALAVRPEPENQKLAAEALARYRKVKTDLATFEKEATGGRLAKIKPAVIGQAHVTLNQLHRLAERLVIRGETAGVDFQLRARHLERRMREIISLYRKLDGMVEQMARDYEVLRREGQKKQAILPRLKQMADRQQWEAAQAALYEAVDDLETMCVWYGGQQRLTVLGGLVDAILMIDRKTREFRQSRAQAALAEKRGKVTPDFDALLADLADAATSLRSASTVDADGQPLAGPLFLAKFAQRWQEAQHRAVLCEGLDLARGATAPNGPLAQLLAEQANFSNRVGPAIAGLIDAEADRAAPEEARGLLVGYLGQVAPLVALSSGSELAKAVEPAFARLAGKSPELAAEVEAYRAATSEVLRWRRRSAAASAKARQEKFPPFGEAFLWGVKTVDKTPGLVPDGAGSTNLAELSNPVPEVMPSIAKRLIDQQTTLSDLVGLPIEKRVTVARYRARGYAQFEVPEALATSYAAAIASLDADLLVDGSSPPLTLEAAVALVRARRGDLAAAGGKITGITLEPLPTRFATLPPAGRTLVPLGPLPNEGQAEKPLHQVVTQFVIAPAWIQHECFFVLAK